MQNIREENMWKYLNLVKQSCKWKQGNSDQQWLHGILSKFSSKDKAIDAMASNTKEQENSGSFRLKIEPSMS